MSEKFRPDMKQEFVTLRAMRQLVEIAMRGRVGEKNVLLPLEEERVRINVPNGLSMMPGETVTRDDIVLPPLESASEDHPEGGKMRRSYGHNVLDALYDGLAPKETRDLSTSDARMIASAKEALKDGLALRNDLEWWFDENQVQDAYHAHAKQLPESTRIISPLRIYVAGGLQALRIAREVIENGADFVHAKIWTPQAAAGPQTIRYDAPIFSVNTEGQLHLTLEALRTVLGNGVLSTSPEHASPLGISVRNMPGVMVAQQKQSSFNGEMARFFADPVTTACNHPDLALRAGDVVTSEWLDTAARMAREAAYARAEVAGLHPQSHALLRGQDLSVVMTAVQR